MTYEYACECGEISSKELSMSDNIPTKVRCKACGKLAGRIWGNMSLHVPESMKATSDLYNSDTGSNADYLKTRMNKGARPSGKTKVFY